jgi:hypothetical protein
MDSPLLTDVDGLEKRFGLPARWFKAEAAAGRLPCLKVGRRFRFNPEAIERALAERAAGEACGKVVSLVR